MISKDARTGYDYLVSHFPQYSKFYQIRLGSNNAFRACYVKEGNRFKVLLIDPKSRKRYGKWGHGKAKLS